MQLSCALAGIGLLFCSFATVATDVGGLNSARVAVADRSDAEFERGLANALEAVIVKLTGSSETARTPRSRVVIGRAQRLVQQFGYERLYGDNSQALFMRVEFDARVLSEEMRSRNLVVWGKERPDTLVWIIIDSIKGRQLLAGQDNHELLGALQNRARARGIPLIFPLGDIIESRAVMGHNSAAELEQALRQRSQIYGVGSVLTGYLQQVLPNLWEIQWQLRVEGESLRWEQQGDLVGLLVEEAADSLADALGRRYAAPALHAHADSIEVTVTGVTSPTDYARTERYLRTVDSVTDLMVRRVNEQAIVFALTVRGGLPALAQIVSFGQILSPDLVDNTVFRLNPR
jgi:hypothetical protein